MRAAVFHGTQDIRIDQCQRRRESAGFWRSPALLRFSGLTPPDALAYRSWRATVVRSCSGSAFDDLFDGFFHRHERVRFLRVARRLALFLASSLDSFKR